MKPTTARLLTLAALVLSVCLPCDAHAPFGSGVGVPTPTSTTHFDANNRITAAFGATHDSTGNLTKFDRPGIAYDWTAAYDANNKQTLYCGNTTAACTTTNRTVRYYYDGAGNRVRREACGTAGCGTTVYVYDAFGKLAAEYGASGAGTSGGLTFRTVDHLGTTRIATNPSGKIVTRQDFFPFGEEIPANASYGGRNLILDGLPATTYNRPVAFDQKFTAKERDDKSGLDYFGARYYSASFGRFVGADPDNAGARTGNPQSWNGYSYSVNSPIRYIDPDGKDFVDVVEGFANAFGTNPVGGIGRVEPRNNDFRVGQAIGDAASVAAGLININTGGTAAVSGGMMALSGGGTAPGLAVAGSGIVLAGVGIQQVSQGAANLLAAAQDGNPTSGAASQEPLIGSNPRETKGRTNTDLPGGHKAATDLFAGRTQGQQVKADPKTGHQVAADGTRLRLNPDGTARVDVPKSTTRPKHETIHFNDPD